MMIVLILLGILLGIIYYYSPNLVTILIDVLNLDIDRLTLMIVGAVAIFIVTTITIAKVKNMFKIRDIKFRAWAVYIGWLLSVLIIIMFTPELRMSSEELGSHVFMKAGGYFLIGLSFIQLTLAHLFSNLMVKKLDWD